MDPVLTEASSVSCDHPPTGGGKVALEATQDVLKVDGNAVLTGSLANAAIAVGCAQTNTAAGQVICSLVQSQTGETSRVLTVNGTAVLLHKSSGQTNGKPDAAWSSKDAGQAVLKAD
jgi:hypothetical protein